MIASDCTIGRLRGRLHLWPGEARGLESELAGFVGAQFEKGLGAVGLDGVRMQLRRGQGLNPGCAAAGGLKSGEYGSDARSAAVSGARCGPTAPVRLAAPAYRAVHR